MYVYLLTPHLANPIMVISCNTLSIVFEVLIHISTKESQ